jgi:hypothetical protein
MTTGLFIFHFGLYMSLVAVAAGGRVLGLLQQSTLTLLVTKFPTFMEPEVILSDSQDPGNRS